MVVVVIMVSIAKVNKITLYCATGALFYVPEIIKASCKFFFVF